MSDAEVSETSVVTRVFGHEIKADSFAWKFECITSALFFTEQSIKRRKKKKKKEKEKEESTVLIISQVVRAAGFRTFCDVV